LCDIHTLLSAAMHEGMHQALEVLISGRICLEDLHALLLLRRAGILEPPKFLPRWLRNWNELLPYFAFTSFFHELHLPDITAKHQKLIEACKNI
jgi:hypothetical protein